MTTDEWVRANIVSYPFSDTPDNSRGGGDLNSGIQTAGSTVQSGFVQFPYAEEGELSPTGLYIHGAYAHSVDEEHEIPHEDSRVRFIINGTLVIVCESSNRTKAVSEGHNVAIISWQRFAEVSDDHSGNVYIDEA